jgi:hypothetical protein
LASTRLLRRLENQAVLAQRDQEPQPFQVELADDRVESSGVVGLDHSWVVQRL